MPILGTFNLGTKISYARGKKFVKVNIDTWCKSFSFLAHQRNVQFLYDTLDTLIEALGAFTVRQI